MPEIEDLMIAALDKKPQEFGDVFHDLMLDKVTSLINNKREEIAKTLFQPKLESPEE